MMLFISGVLVFVDTLFRSHPKQNTHGGERQRWSSPRLVVFPNVIIGLVSLFLSTTAGRVSVVIIRALICRLCSIGVLLTLPLRGRSTIVPFSVHRGGMRLEKEILRIFERN
jgi:hypothetical protein